MIVFAIIATIVAICWSIMVLFANGMRSSPGEFKGGGSIIAAFIVASICWLAWVIG